MPFDGQALGLEPLHVSLTNLPNLSDAGRVVVQDASETVYYVSSTGETTSPIVIASTRAVHVAVPDLHDGAPAMLRWIGQQVGVAPAGTIVELRVPDSFGFLTIDYAIDPDPVTGNIPYHVYDFPVVPHPTLTLGEGPFAIQGNAAETNAVQATLSGTRVEHTPHIRQAFVDVPRASDVSPVPSPVPIPSFLEPCSSALDRGGVFFGGDGRDFFFDHPSFKARVNVDANWVFASSRMNDFSGVTKLYNGRREFIASRQAGAPLTADAGHSLANDTLTWTAPHEAANPFCDDSLFSLFPNDGITAVYEGSVTRAGVAEVSGVHDQFPSFGVFRLDTPSSGVRVLHLWRQNDADGAACLAGIQCLPIPYSCTKTTHTSPRTCAPPEEPAP